MMKMSTVMEAIGRHRVHRVLRPVCSFLYTQALCSVVFFLVGFLRNLAASATAGLIDAVVQAAAHGQNPKGSVEVLLLVTAFNISGWSGPATRTQYKAMRPLEFETYELVCPERGFKALIEVVSSGRAAVMPKLCMEFACTC